MSSSALNVQVPPDMSHYPPEILEKYLTAVQQAREKGEDSDEAMFSDTDEGTDDDDDDPKPQDDTVNTMISQMQKMDIAVLSEIHAGDSGFSSEDEFTDDNLRHILHIRRELILGRPPTELQDWKPSKIVDYYLGYIKQLNDADMELEELLAQCGSASRAVRSEAQGHDSRDQNDGLLELRNRTVTEIQGTDRDQLVRELVILAQELFRKEKKIKRIVEVQGISIISPAH